MFTGELTFSENMFVDDEPTTPYYKVTYIVYILFAIGMTILVGNLLTSMKNLFYLIAYTYLIISVQK
jgi:hypothetical protein